MSKLLKLLKHKFVIAGTALVLTLAVILTSMVMFSRKPSIPVQQDGNSSETSSEITVQIPSNEDGSFNGSDDDNTETGSTISVDVGSGSKPDSSQNTKSPAVQSNSSSQGGTKTTSKADDTVSVGTGNNTSSDPKSPGSSTDGVISVDPVPRGDEPSGASGLKPQSTDWVSINSSIPQELYYYNYTIMDGEDIITGAQMKWRGYTTWDQAANAAKSGLAKYNTIDYRKITSIDPNDRDKFLTDLVYWTGEAAHMDICEYMKFAINNKIISTASVVTDGSLMYNNGYQLIRARVYVTFQSGAGAYGLQNGVKYYRDVEVAVYPSNHENRYGFGECNDFNVLIFSYLNNLCAWKKA